MCGIAGFRSFDGESAELLRSTAERMAAALRHRGPDDEGVFVESGAGVAFGFRRLAILDLSAAGAQPMQSAGGRYITAFNGEIYNYRRLRSRLEEEGQAPEWRGHSDTEVLLAAIEAWGVEGAARELIGMYAFAVWDRQERSVSLVRDRAGVKPLYFQLTPAALLFASELRALERHPRFDGVIDPEAAALFARYRYVPSPRSIYRGTKKLAPGTILTIDSRGTASTTVYWDAGAIAEHSAEHRFQGSDDEAILRLEEILADSVALRMIADVPLGVFLSGGVDSSLIAALMQRRASGPIHTFTIGLEDPRFDEASEGREVARLLGSQHHERYVRESDALTLLPRIPQIYDEPFADSSALPTYLVSELARESVTVALSGDGGDELFAGYHRHFLGQRLQQRVEAVPRFARSTAGRILQRFARSRSFGTALLEDDLLATYDRNVSLSIAAQETRPPWQRPALRDPVEAMMFVDFSTYLPDDILTKVDRASMAVSLEARTPFLDHRLIEFAWSLPLSMKIREGRGKWILRALLRRDLPAAVVDREKRGFGLPLAVWLRGPLRDWSEALLSESNDGVFHSERVRELWNRHLAGENHEAELWTVLSWRSWMQRDRLKCAY